MVQAPSPDSGPRELPYDTIQYVYNSCAIVLQAYNTHVSMKTNSSSLSVVLS